MTEKLKKCPMCGKDVATITFCKELEECANFEECGDSGFVCVVCGVNDGGCGASGGYSNVVEKAIELWNTRTV